MPRRHGRDGCVRVGITFCAVLLLTAGAEAQRKKTAAKPRAKAKQQQTAPESPQISASMGELKWGMSTDEVLAWAVDGIKERYRPELAKTNDAISEDALRHRMTQDIRGVRDSLVRFEGKTTGWDVSFLRDEFTHNNRESMLVVRDKNSKNFYFFINDKLWKWYKAFDAEVFHGKSFDAFANVIQGHFGAAKQAQGELTPGAGARSWLEWQDGNSRLRAVDQTRFYGFYCLVFEDKNTVAQLASLRRNAPQRRAESHALVDAVTSGHHDEQTDHAPDVVDRITGQRRNRGQAAPASAGAGKGGRNAEPVSSSNAAPASSSGVTAEDDPLRGLDF